MPEEEIHAKFEVDGLATELTVFRYEGAEALSELFRFEVLIGAREAIDFGAVVGHKAVLSIPTEAAARYVHGIVARLEHWSSGLGDHAMTLYRAVLVPRVSNLLRRVDSRIFQDKSAPDVIKAVLEGAGLAANKDFKLALTGTYAAREYCVQYRESDWDFVSRLMEDEGIAYFFDHKDDKTVLTILDHVEAYLDAEPKTMLYNPDQGAMARRDRRITRFAYVEEVRSTATMLRDFDFRKPALSLEASDTTSSGERGEIYDYPGNYLVPADGTARAKLRLQELRSLHKTGEGDSTYSELSAGFVITLGEHPYDSFNSDYLVTRVEHRGREEHDDRKLSDDGEDARLYENVFQLTPKTLPFRPARVTEKPTIRGVQTAIVVGPANEEIYTDEHGRVKVQFHWDRLGKKDEKSSCWIRVSQAWAGGAWGSIHVPRVHDEVVVAFLEGDPDRPLIVGRVYHGTNVPPYALPANKTQSGIKSRSTPKDEGSNELRFEDKKGSEEVYLHAQKDETILVENDKNQTIGHDETLDVKNDRTKHIEHDQKLKVDHDDAIEIGHDRTEKIDHDEKFEVGNDRTAKIGHDLKEEIGNDETLKVGKDRTRKVEGKETIHVVGAESRKTDGAQTLTIGGDVTHKYEAKHGLSITSDSDEKIDGARSEKVGKDKTVAIDGAYSIKVTKDSKEDVTGSKKITVTQKLEITVGQSKLTLGSDGTIKIEGVQFELKCSGPVKINGMTIDVSAQTTAKVEGTAKLDLKSSGPVSVNGAGPLTAKGAIVQVG